MKIQLWGTRGSLASPGPDTVRYGGNTSCVSILGSKGTLLVLDAGTGIRSLGRAVAPDTMCVHILLTHLHMDHLQGLPFFEPLRHPGVEVHLWGPASTTLSLQARLLRYLSPPLFPVRVRDLLPNLYFHEVSGGSAEIGEFTVCAQLVVHPNPTVGYRVREGSSVMAYMPDHEPALGAHGFPRYKEWTSGYGLAENVDVLIHDSQYTPDEYETRAGFGHSSIEHSYRFAEMVGAQRLVPFHHDPDHSDDMLDRMISEATQRIQPNFMVTPGKEGLTIDL